MDNSNINAALRAALLFQRASRLRSLLATHGSDAFAGALASCPPRLVAEALAHLPADEAIRVRLTLSCALKRDLRRLSPPPVRRAAFSDGGHARVTGEQLA